MKIRVVLNKSLNFLFSLLTLISSVYQAQNFILNHKVVVVLLLHLD